MVGLFAGGGCAGALAADGGADSGFPVCNGPGGGGVGGVGGAGAHLAAGRSGPASLQHAFGGEAGSGWRASGAPSPPPPAVASTAAEVQGEEADLRQQHANAASALEALLSSGSPATGVDAD